MNIPSDQIAYKKKVGKLGDCPVIELATKGGLHLVVSVSGSRIETLGTGPHRAVARHIAKKRKPDLEFTDLNKADAVPVECYEWILPRYEALTDDLRRLEGSEG